MAQTYPLFCIGNPLLDMQVNNGEAILEKYKLKANDAILAGEEHMSIYEEIVENHKITYVAGGAAQNAARGAAYVLPPNSVVYTGCVGSDDLAEQLRNANSKEGVASAYQVKQDEKTGACAVILTGHERSLVTTLRAAEKFNKEHLSSPEVAPLVDGAKFYYVGGFFLTHGVESALVLAKKASETGKTFALNLSAPFICQFFGAQLGQVFPYVDLLIGNESEAAAWAAANGLETTTSLEVIAKTLANLSKINPSRPRTVVITSGPDATIVAKSGQGEDPKTYPVGRLADKEIVDTNGAGDMFAGGLIGALVAGKSLDEAVEAGHKLGAMCVKTIGPQLQFPKVQII
ncbi:adenosine kinase [Rhizoctonia solani AG-3 Rhs1AP]|uniref:Adenosine kinase n=2 Tax=Rhizoctonia solani AG-3 TaxID=1086053 RepID=A0A074RXL9_9AGAM|nr:adenosine kinase [Rhizoctonia solani AG-3 Rhs1AP]KEP51831.1 adenosine kinase [Rhizoctonia solani 123E]